MVPKTPDQIIASLRDLPLQWTPGERYAYNNSRYFLLGVIIEKITDRSVRVGHLRRQVSLTA